MVDSALRAGNNTQIKNGAQSRFDTKSIVSLVGSNDMRWKNPKLVVLHQNICSLKEKNNRIGSVVVFGIKACRYNMPHRTLAE